MMHELPITKSIFQIILRHAKVNHVKRVIAVNLEIGALSDLQDKWIQRYFDRLSRGTVVEGAKLKINRVPAVFRCDACQAQFEVNALLDADLSCAQCHSSRVSLISGREYQVKSMEAQ
jgi:hydrogenase nickel incorporation protein HypA/HybF